MCTHTCSSSSWIKHSSTSTHKETSLTDMFTTQSWNVPLDVQLRGVKKTHPPNTELQKCCMHIISSAPCMSYIHLFSATSACPILFALPYSTWSLPSAPRSLPMLSAVLLSTSTSWMLLWYSRCSAWQCMWKGSWHLIQPKFVAPGLWSPGLLLHMKTFLLSKVCSVLWSSLDNILYKVLEQWPLLLGWSITKTKLCHHKGIVDADHHVVEKDVTPLSRTCVGSDSTAPSDDWS